MNRRRVRFRPPGVKPGAKVGPWGPFRGRLGAQWWIASLVVGGLLLVVAWYLLVPAGRPGPEWRSVGAVETIVPGEAREVGHGIFVGRRFQDGRPFAVAEPEGCPLEVTESLYHDCRGTTYRLDGFPEGPGEPLRQVPLQVHEGEIFVKPS